MQTLPTAQRCTVTCTILLVLMGVLICLPGSSAQGAVLLDEQFNADVIASGDWIVSDASIAVDVANGWLRIGSDGEVDDFADKTGSYPLPLVIEWRERTYVGDPGTGPYYTLPRLEFWFGTSSNDSYHIMYSGVDNTGLGGWLFGGWTNVLELGPTNWNQWRTVKAVIRSDGGELFAKEDGQLNFTHIFSATWTIPDVIQRFRLGQTSDDVSDFDYLQVTTQDCATLPLEEHFSSDVIGSGSWSVSDASVSVDAENGWLRIGPDGAVDDFAERCGSFPLPLVIEWRERLVSGGQNYTLPNMGFFWGPTNEQADYITYLPNIIDGNRYGWRFGNEWTDIHTLGPTSENQWLTVKAIIRSDGGELSAKADGDSMFTPIVTKAWSIPSEIVRFRLVQHWDAICEYDYFRASAFVPDADGDGIPDEEDNCPLIANASQTDYDGDGIGDICDIDDDNDGVADTLDNCPLAQNADQTDWDGDGVGNECDMLTSVFVDIKPGSCPNPINSRSQGSNSQVEEAGENEIVFEKQKPDQPQPSKAVLPVAILGTEDFDVSNIAVSSLRLEGVPALRWGLEDVSSPVAVGADVCECTEIGMDGLLDLTLKFDRSAIIEALGEVYDGDIIPLTISGTLTDGRPLTGTDCVVIIAGNGGSNAMVDESVSSTLANYPNPFNPSTDISFSLPKSGQVKLVVYNILGAEVATLVDEVRSAGVHRVTWNGVNSSGQQVASGIYLYRLTAGDFAATKKMLLLK